jgi:hypothetical protein
MNKWFHTLCTGQGPHGTSTSAISFDDAIRIVYRALTVGFRTNSTYPHARDVTTQAARDLFGDCSAQEQAVIAAWATAGLSTIGCGDGGRIALNACYKIKMANNDNQVQAMSDNSVQQKPPTADWNQIWKAEDRGNNRLSFTVQDGTNRSIRTVNGGGYGELLTLGQYTGNGQHDWAVERYTAVANQWRLYRPGNNYTWDVQNWGQNPQIQIWGNTGENFANFRMFRFEKLDECPNTACEFTPTLTTPTANPQCGQTITLNVGCQGSACGSGGFTYSWIGGNSTSTNVTLPNSSEQVTYIVTVLKTGCTSKYAQISIYPSGCGDCFMSFNRCVKIKAESNGKYFQAMGDNSVQTQPMASVNSQIWRVNSVSTMTPGPKRSFTVQDGTNRAIGASLNANFGEGLSLGTFINDGRYEWTYQCSPSDNQVWRIFRASSTNTWDVQNWGQGPTMNIWGNTQDPFVAFRSYRLEDVTCPAGGRRAADEVTFALNLSVSPNPNDGHLRVRFNTRDGEVSSLRITDLTGKSVLASQAVAGTGQVYEGLVSLPAAIRGMVILSVTSGQQQESVKVLLTQ